MATATPDPATAAGTLTLGGELTVNRLGFGAMRVTGAGVWGEPEDAAAARQVLREAVALGVNFIDTADSYGPGVSERLIRESLAPYPPGLVIATKGGLVRPAPYKFDPKGDPAHLRQACLGSLERLGLQRIDLYQFHFPDPEVPLRTSLAELARLQQEGKIRHIGLSNVSVEQLQEARELVEVVSVQNRYNLVDRSAEPVLDYCEHAGIAFIPWFPLQAGRHSSRDKGTLPPALVRVAEAHGATPAQIALAWLLARSPVMLPIPGTGSVAHLRENVAAAAIRLEPAELAELDDCAG